MPINTLKISQDLEEATVPKQQADAIAVALLNVTAADLASKADVADLRTDIAELELRTVKEINAVKEDIAQLELRTVKEFSLVRKDVSDLREALAKGLSGITDRILWPLGIIAAITWIMQLWGGTIATALSKIHF